MDFFKVGGMFFFVYGNVMIFLVVFIFDGVGGFIFNGFYVVDFFWNLLIKMVFSFMENNGF